MERRTFLMNSGILEEDGCTVRHHGESWKRRNDDAGGYYGLQPMSPGWSKSFSPEMVKELDSQLQRLRRYAAHRFDLSV